MTHTTSTDDCRLKVSKQASAFVICDMNKKDCEETVNWWDILSMESSFLTLETAVDQIFTAQCLLACLFWRFQLSRSTFQSEWVKSPKYSQNKFTLPWKLRFWPPMKMMNGQKLQNKKRVHLEWGLFGNIKDLYWWPWGKKVTRQAPLKVHSLVVVELSTVSHSLHQQTEFGLSSSSFKLTWVIHLV